MNMRQISCALCFVLCIVTNDQVVYSCEKEVHSYCGGHVEATSNPTFLSSPGGELVMVVVVMVVVVMTLVII